MLFQLPVIDLKKKKQPRLSPGATAPGPTFLNEVRFRLTFTFLKNQSSSVHCTCIMNFSKHEVRKNTNSCLSFLYTALLFSVLVTYTAQCILVMEDGYL